MPLPSFVVGCLRSPIRLVAAGRLPCHPCPLPQTGVMGSMSRWEAAKLRAGVVMDTDLLILCFGLLCSVPCRIRQADEMNGDDEGLRHWANHDSDEIAQIPPVSGRHQTTADFSVFRLKKHGHTQHGSLSMHLLKPIFRLRLSLNREYPSRTEALPEMCLSLVPMPSRSSQLPPWPDERNGALAVYLARKSIRLQTALRPLVRRLRVLGDVAVPPRICPTLRP